MLELKTKELKFKFNGKEEVIIFPTVAQSKQFSKDYQEAQDKEQATKAFLVNLGLNPETYDMFQNHHLETIIKELTVGK